MKSVIEQILFGKRTSAQIKLSERGKAILAENVESEDAFLKTVKEGKDAELYKRFMDAVDDMHYEERVAYYKEGFRLGFLLALEVLEEE